MLNCTRCTNFNVLSMMRTMMVITIAIIKIAIIIAKLTNRMVIKSASAKAACSKVLFNKTLFAYVPPLPPGLATMMIMITISMKIKKAFMMMLTVHHDDCNIDEFADDGVDHDGDVEDNDYHNGDVEDNHDHMGDVVDEKMLNLLGLSHE